MELRILAVGDVVGDGGLQCLERHLRSLKKLYRIDFCVVNGENASGTGLNPKQADRMLDAGADVLTLGNHSFDRREICAYLDDCPYILRPANLQPSLPGRGFGVFETKIGPVGVVNRCFWISTPRRRAKSLPWRIIWTERSPPSGVRTHTCRPQTSRSCRRARGI